MTELTQHEYERTEVQAQEAREAFFDAVVRVPAILEAWRRWQQAESQALEARRARRESEVHE